MSKAVKDILAASAGRQPKRDQNKRSAYKTLIRERMSEMGVEVNAGYFTAAREKQINNILRQYDWDFLMRSVDWIYDNWYEIKRSGMYRTASYPTFGILVSAATLEHYYHYIRDGVPLEQVRQQGFNTDSADTVTAPDTDMEAKFAELDRLRAEKAANRNR